MSSFRFDTQFFAVIGLIFLTYFVWMDVGLYYNLNSATGNLLVKQNYQKLNQSDETTKNSNPNYFFDPYNPISVKLLAMDHINHYVHYPLSWWLDSHVFHITDQHTFITPDMISYFHVLIAILAAKLLVSEGLGARRLGVLLFEFRTFLDSYDGYVARARANQVAMVQASGGWGFYMDGLCDLVGVVMFMIGILILLKRSHEFKRMVVVPLIPGCFISLCKKIKNLFISSKSEYKLTINDLEKQENLLAISKSTIRSGDKERQRNGGLIYSQTCISIWCLSILQVLGSIFWNRYLQSYHTLLEIPVVSAPINMEFMQIQTMQSASFWIIIWSWKLFNTHAFMAILQYSVFFDQHLSVISWIQYLAFAPMFVLIFMSEMHLQATKLRLWYIQ